MQKAAQTPFSYFYSLPRAEQERLRKVSEWKWAATVGDDTIDPVEHSLHSEWVKVEGNTHSPSHREVMFVLSCDSETDVYGLAGKVYPKVPGTVFLFDHYEARDWKRSAHNNAPFTVLWLHFQIGGKKGFTYNTLTRTADGRSFRAIARRFYLGDAPRLITEAWDRCKQYPDERLHWELLKSQVTSAILEVLCRTQLKAPSNQQGQIVEFVQQYIDTHYTEELNLRYLSHLAGYSPFFFHRIFRAHIGETPKEYLNRVRLEKAKELLLQGYTVTAVAEAVGASSPFSFSRFFKERTGHSPSDWSSKNSS